MDPTDDRNGEGSRRRDEGRAEAKRRRETDEALAAERTSAREELSREQRERNHADEELGKERQSRAKDAAALEEAHRVQGRDAVRRDDRRSERSRARGARERAAKGALDRERRHGESVLRDERARAEERARLLAAAREAQVAAEAATRMRDEFLAIVSHDLKNPVGAILMNAALVLARAAPGDDPRLRRALESIHRSAQRALRIIDDLLDVAAIDAGRAAMELRPEPVARLLGEAVESFRLRALERSLALGAHLGVDPRATVLCDPGRIQEVLANLIGNALKFTPEGGTVRVTAEPVAGRVRFAVTDTGPGIPEPEREKVFERFWQARAASTGGKGLGLYIARRIVEEHGGRIWAEAGPEGGTRIAFEIPLADRACRAA